MSDISIRVGKCWKRVCDCLSCVRSHCMFLLFITFVLSAVAPLKCGCNNYNIIPAAGIFDWQGRESELVRKSENDRLLESERERVWPVKYLPAGVWHSILSHMLENCGNSILTAHLLREKERQRHNRKSFCAVLTGDDSTARPLYFHPGSALRTSVKDRENVSVKCMQLEA